MKAVRFLLAFVLTVTLGGAALGGIVLLFVPAGAGLSDALTYGPIDPESNRPAQRSYMFDRFGNQMTTLFDVEDRQPITLDDVPKHLIDAVIAIEDRKFYEHDGVDLNGILRALVENLDAGEVEQGGSTITQQLVKNTLSDPKKRDLKTKFKEAVLAVRLENDLEKDEILEQYLNVIYLGNGAYGVQAAAERYFNKQPRDLTLGEAALLAGLIKAPESLNPVKHPADAARRRNKVLDVMVELDMVAEAEAGVARQEPLPLTATSPLRTRDYFTEEVLQQLLNDDPAVDGDVAEHLGPTNSARFNAVFNGGLRIHTTYDPLLQYIAKGAVDNTLPDDTEFTAAVVVIDNADGSIRAMYTGRQFSESQYNPITQKGRPTGSAFKAITLAAALDRGYSPKDIVSGGSIRLPRYGEDYSQSCGGGGMTLTEAIVSSNNCAFLRILVSMGPGHFGDDGAQPVIDMAERLGIDGSKLDQVPVLTLGVSDVNMLDMAEAFSVFANEGVHKQPSFVTKIENADNEVIFDAGIDAERVLDANVARSITSALTGVIERGTGRSARLDRPAAGKTGTNTDNKDAWFVGYTPQYTTAVWMGHPDTPVAMNDVGGVRVQGGTYPAQIWKAFMQPAHDPLPVTDFVPPDEKLWPTTQRVNESGRSVTREFAERAATTTTTVELEPTATSTVPATIPEPTTVPPPPPAPETVPPPAAPGP